MFAFTRRLSRGRSTTRRKAASWRPILHSLEDRTLLSSGLTAVSGTPDAAALMAQYAQVPLSFEANEGQTDAQVRFLSRGNGYGLFLTPREAVLNLQGDSLRLQFVGANPNPTVVGAGRQDATSNYFIGNDPTHWRANVANYDRVIYRDVYPGIDIVFYGNQSQFEYDFLVAPGADPGVIRLRIDGSQGMQLDATGNLVLNARHGEVVQHAPVLYQETGTTRQSVAGQFVLEGDNQIAFRIGEYDRGQMLTIDPILSYSTYLGGSGLDATNQIAVDPTGNVYVVGRTYSTDFPTLNPPQPTKQGAVDLFVAKLNAAGTALVYSTYLGGNEALDETPNGIAVNAVGEAYVTGYTDAANFPVAGAIQSSYGGGGDAFAFKLNASGTAILYSTYLGGSGFDQGGGVALDGLGNAYVAGYTRSANFPTANAFQSTRGGPEDAFLTKILSDGSALVYSTYLGGSSNESAAYRCVAVDSLGSAYVTGQTLSGNFPTLNAFQPNFGGGDGDAFISKFTPDGSALVYSSYLGGSLQDAGQAIAVDGSGSAYLAGSTNSSNFPTVNAFQPGYGGGRDAFITTVNAAGSAVTFSTYLGGSGEDRILGLALDGGDNVWGTGQTLSSNFPTAFATQSNAGGGWDAFVTRMNAAGTALDYSTYLGGSGDDFGLGLAIGSGGDVYVSGGTGSTNFPTLNPFQGSYGGGTSDAFITRFDIRPALVASLVVDNGAAQRSMVRSLTVTFNQVVTVGANAFEVRLNGGAAVAFTPSVSVVNGQTVVLLTVTGGGSLADGRYTLTVRANQVTDGLGNQLDGGTDYVANFHRLYGDANGDATVNAFDYSQFRPAFGSSTGDPTFVEWLDFDGDGTINASDLGQFRDRFGISLP